MQEQVRNTAPRCQNSPKKIDIFNSKENERELKGTAEESSVLPNNRHTVKPKSTENKFFTEILQNFFLPSVYGTT